MSTYKEVPVVAAEAVAAEFDKDQVVIVTWNKAHGTTSVTTYGKTAEDCVQAAMGGNAVKRALGWPETLCHATPPRAQAKDVVLVRGDEEWEGLYVDGRLVLEGHSLTGREILRALDIPVTAEIMVTNSWLNDLGRLPHRLINIPEEAIIK